MPRCQSCGACSGTVFASSSKAVADSANCPFSNAATARFMIACGFCSTRAVKADARTRTSTTGFTFAPRSAVALPFGHRLDLLHITKIDRSRSPLTIADAIDEIVAQRSDLAGDRRNAPGKVLYRQAPRLP